ncbi:kelch repeat-containing protein [Pseudoduganella sp. HUAS MS19]
MENLLHLPPLSHLAAATLLACATLSAQAQVSTGSMSAPRMLHKASVLPDGRILLTGGTSKPGNPIHASTEIYDPATAQFTPAAPMLTARRQHAAVTLQDGRILVAGGMTPASTFTNTAEIYDPATGQWTATGNMNVSRYDTVGLRLSDGRVMITDKRNASAYQADIYDPATGLFTKTGNMLERPNDSGLVLLPDGRVLKMGGFANNGYSRNAELWDPATNQWTATGQMNEQRQNIQPVVLADGKVLVAGGRREWSHNTTELYDPATGVFTPAANMPTAFEPTNVSVLPSGDIVFTADYNRQLLRYQAASGTWNMSGPQRSTARDSTLSRLPDGNVLIAGGAAQNDATTYAAIWEQACAGQLTTVPVRTQTAGGDAGTVSFTVNAAPGCRFEAANLPDWLTLAGTNPQQMPASGSATVTFNTSTNLSGASRSASFLLGNESVTVTQVASANCPSAPVVSPTTTTVSGSGGSGSLSVFAAASCPWNVASMPSFVTATGATSGSGNGSIPYSVAANPDTTASRSGSGQVTSMGYATTFTFTQDARKLCPTAPVISLSNASFTAAGGSTTGTITAAPTCKWALAVPVTWVSVTSGASGTGNGSFSLNIAPNTGADRSDYMLASNPDAVGMAKLSQTGSACATWSVTPASTNFPAAGTSGNFTVSAPASCNWNLAGVPSWMNITSAMSGTGNGSITYSVSANSGTARNATATLSGSGLTLPLSLNQQGTTQPTVCSKSIISGETVSGNLQSSACPAGARGSGYYTDRYIFSVLPGRVVTITLASSSFDAYLYLRDGSGNVISSNDDGGGGTNSRISYTLPAGAWGNYTIEATSYYSGRSGAYTLTFTQ